MEEFRKNLPTNSAGKYQVHNYFCLSDNRSSKFVTIFVGAGADHALAIYYGRFGKFRTTFTQRANSPVAPKPSDKT